MLTLITPKKYNDDRGWFVESWSLRAFSRFALTEHFVQDNQSLSRSAHTLRGLHFQYPPHAQVKLVRCLRGRLLDVCVDLRKGSPTYGQVLSVELSAENGKQLHIPVGFAHGFVTLEPNTEIAYKVSDYYAPECDAGIIWNDEDLGIDWQLGGQEPHLSPKDRGLMAFRDFDSPFDYNGMPMGLREVGHAD